MNAISIGYRFTRHELSTLLQALRLGALPGAPLSPVDDRSAALTLKRLAEKEIAIVADGTLYVDKLTHYLLLSAAEAASAVVVTDGDWTAVLWAAEKVYILGVFPSQGECSLTPLQDAQSAGSALGDAILRMRRPIWGMSVFDPRRRFSFAEDDPSDEESVARVALSLLEGDAPTKGA